MKKILSILFVLTSFFSNGQNNDCIDRILAKNGGWKKLSITNTASQSDYVIQKKFTDNVYAMLSSYQPRGIQLQWDGSHQSSQYGRPVASYAFNCFAMQYTCQGDGLVLNHETNTNLDVRFNNDFEHLLFETTADDYTAGFNVLHSGVPEEIAPGIWRFNDVRTGLGFGLFGFTKLWLITYPGHLPLSYVTRREFLVKRKQALQSLLALEEPHYKEQLQKWETEKKYKEQEAKNDPKILERFMNVDYKPAIKREQDNFKKSKLIFDAAMERVDQQLAEPSSELDKRAIVMKSTTNYLDYNFTDKVEPLAEILVKPNPAYFKKGLAPSVPQLIEVAIQYYHQDSVYSSFAREISKQIDLNYLQSFIGKTAPLPFSANKNPQNNSSAIQTSIPIATETVAVFSTASSESNTAKATRNNNSSNSFQSITASQSTFAKKVFLTGTLSAPSGVPVTLTYNGVNDLSITGTNANGNLYTTTPIKFAKPLNENDTYSVAVKKIPSNMKAVIYQGSGKVSNGPNEVKIGVDYKYELITRSTGDKSFSGFYESAAGIVGGMGSEEGRYVAFVSSATNFAGNPGKFRQVFWRDRNTGITKLISQSPDGTLADADCALPSMSADGQIVVFESAASNLVSGDNNKTKDIFLWHAQNNTIELVSKTANGSWSNGESFDATVSGNGQFVVYTSDAVNMSSAPKGQSLYNIFLRDLTNGKTEMLSVDPNLKTGANGVKGSISFDGSRVTFCSPSNTLVSGDNNNLWDIFLWEKGKQGLRRISLTYDGKERNQGEESASRQVASTISGNGKYVVYATTATNMVPGDNEKYQDVFVYDIDKNKLQVASFTEDGKPGNHDSPIDQGERIAISYDGAWVAFSTKASNLGAPSSNIILYNTTTGKKQTVSNTNGSYVSSPAISYSGSYVVFGKGEPMDIRMGQAFGTGIFAHFTGNGPCRDCK